MTSKRRKFVYPVNLPNKIQLNAQGLSLTAPG
jgi:hypothetical protein